MKNLGQFGKATYSGVLAFLGSLAVVIVGDVGFAEITDGQWITAAVIGLGSAGGVYGLPYKPAG